MHSLLLSFHAQIVGLLISFLIVSFLRCSVFLLCLQILRGSWPGCMIADQHLQMFCIRCYSFSRCARIDCASHVLPAFFIIITTIYGRGKLHVLVSLQPCSRILTTSFGGLSGPHFCFKKLRENFWA